MFRKTVCFLLALLLMFSFSACKEKTSTDKYIKYPVDSDPVCLDPQIAATDSALLTIASCMEGLTKVDESGQITPGAAESFGNIRR